MTTLFNNLPDELQQNLKDLVSALEKTTLGLRGNRMTDCLEHWLLDDEQKEFLGLNSWNIFFLYAAAHLFETGVPVSFENLDSRARNLDPENIPMPLADTGTICWEDLGITDKDQARIIALICSRARSDAADSDRFNDLEKIVYSGRPVSIALLSGAIRLAAELDLEHPGTAQNIAATARDQIPFGLFCESFTLTSAGPHAFLPGTIQVSICCRRPDVHRALKYHESRLQRLLHSLNGQVSPRFLFSEIIYEIAPTSYTPLDMKFSVDSTAALQLFTGNRLYSDKRVFLRELIQNAVDACNFKKIFNDDYSPKISINFDDQIRVIKFQDNGIGMDRQWIEKYFLKIGISFYQSGDIKAINNNRTEFNFISKFGIGFLSSFLVSDRIVIRTRKNNSPGLIITITSLQDYFDVRFAPEDCPMGTEVTLYLTESKINYCRSIEYIAYLKTNIRFMTIPVELLDQDGRATIIGKEKLVYDSKDTNNCVFTTRLNFPDSEGYLFLKAMRSYNELFSIEPAKGGISIFQDGIFVTQTDTLLPEGARQSVIGRINLTGKDKCELSMDRNRIFWTEQQLLNLKRIIRLGMVDLAGQLLTGTQTLDPPLSVTESLINQLAIFFEFNEIDDEMYYRLGQPVRKIVAKRFRDFVRVNFAHTQKQSHVPEADGYGEKWQQEILAAFRKRSRPPLPPNTFE